MAFFPHYFNFIIIYLSVFAASEILPLRHSGSHFFFSLSLSLFELDVFRSFSVCTFPLPAAFSWHGASPPVQALPLVFCVPREPASLPVVLIERRPNGEADRTSLKAIKLFIQGRVANSRVVRWRLGYRVTKIIRSLENNSDSHELHWAASLHGL